MCAWYALGVVEGEHDRAEGLSAALLWVLDFVEAEQFAGDTRPRYWAIRCLLDSLVRLLIIRHTRYIISIKPNKWHVDILVFDQFRFLFPRYSLTHTV